MKSSYRSIALNVCFRFCVTRGNESLPSLNHPKPTPIRSVYDSINKCLQTTPRVKRRRHPRRSPPSIFKRLTIRRRSFKLLTPPPFHLPLGRNDLCIQPSPPPATITRTVFHFAIYLRGILNPRFIVSFSFFFYYHRSSSKRGCEPLNQR